jgi:hypothetical protein
MKPVEKNIERRKFQRGPRVKSAGQFQGPEPVLYCLEVWAAWMGGDYDRDLGMQGCRGVSGDEGAGPDVYERQQRADAKIAEAVNAMIDSLSRLHMWAIYASCSVATAWRFPNADLVLVAEEARTELEKKLRKNSCTAVLF